MEPLLRLKRSLPQAGLEPRTTRSAGQCLTHQATGLQATVTVSNAMVNLIFTLAKFLLVLSEFQIRKSNRDNSEIIFLISQRKHML